MSHAASVPRGSAAAGRFAKSVAKIPGASCPRLKLRTQLTAGGGSLTQFAQQPLSEVLLGTGQRQRADEGRGGGLRVRRHVWFMTARRASRLLACAKYARTTKLSSKPLPHHLLHSFPAGPRGYRECRPCEGRRRRWDSSGHQICCLHTESHLVTGLHFSGGRELDIFQYVIITGTWTIYIQIFLT